MSTSSRSWLEGTLDVISGMAPRPSTPINNNNGRYASAPNSPARSYHRGASNSSTHGSAYEAPEILRLPSQDSVDRSIHNDSGHGAKHKTNAQIIRDLRQSNARLTARTAALEADFMNQLSEQTRTATTRQHELEDALKEKHLALRQSQAKQQALTKKCQEQEQALQRFKEESAFQRHSISDLKTQLREAQAQETSSSAALSTTLSSIKDNEPLDNNDNDNNNNDAHNAWRLEREELLEQIRQLQRENQRGTPLPPDIADSDLLRAKQALHRTEQALHELQAKAVAQTSQHMEQVEELERQLEISAAAGDSSNTSTTADTPLETRLRHKDETIAELRQKVLQYSQELTAANKKAQTLRVEFDNQEQWRKEEADDLRVLNDAQDEEISNLRQDLCHAKQELALVQQELEDTQDELAAALQQQQQEQQEQPTEVTSRDQENAFAQQQEEAAAAVEKAQEDTRRLQEQLEEQTLVLENAQHEWDESSRTHKDRVAQLSTQVEELKQDKQALLQQIDTMKHADSLQLEQQQQESTAQMDEQQQQQVVDLQNRMDQLLQEKEEECQALISQHETEAESLLADISKHERETKSLQSKISKLEHEREENNELLLEANRRIASFDLDNAQVVQEYKHQIKSLQKQKDAVEAKLQGEQELLQQVSNLQQELQQVQAARKKEQDEHAQQQQQVRQQNDDNASNKSLGSQASKGEETATLRRQVTTLTHSAATLQEKVRNVTSDKDQEVVELKEKLKDRDTTISALVKSTMSMEQQIASTQIEMDLLKAKLTKKEQGEGRSGEVQEEGVDVILAKGDDLGKLKSSLDAYKETETRLSNEVFRLKRQLHHTKLENGRLRQKRTGSSESNHLGEDEHSASGTSQNSSSQQQQQHQTSGPQLQERDDAIARLLKQSMGQDETIAKLKKKVQTLEKTSKDEAEMEQLRQETEMFAGQVIEQDEEIENLKKQLSDHESQLADAEQDSENFKRAADAARTKLKKAQETIVELEKRVTELSAKAHDNTVQSSAAVSASNVDMQRLYSLEAEVDELREANAEQLSELRTLRRKAHDAGVASDEISNAKADMAKAQEVADRLTVRVQSLERELEEVKQGRRSATLPVDDEQSHHSYQSAKKAQEEAAQSAAMEQSRIMDLQHEIVERDRIIGDLKRMADSVASRSQARNETSMDEMEEEGLQSEINSLKQNLVSQESALESARETIRELERMSAEHADAQHAQFEEEKEELLAEVEDLSRQLEEAQSTIDKLRKDELVIQEFKDKLEQADEDREDSERTIIDNYERKLSLLTLDKDVLVDKLRKELATEKEAISIMSAEATTKVASLEAQITELKEHAEAEIQQRDSQIHGLEHTLGASEQLIENMRTEMDHLQGSMVNATAGRREEIEDMQEELVALTATAAKQERELSTLRQELKDKHQAHASEVAKLQETIELLESQRPEETTHHRNAQDLAMELKVKEIKDRLDKLKWRNNSLQEENQTLRERLERGGSGSSPRTMSSSGAELQAAQGKIASLQLKVAEQSKRIQNLEAKLERARQEAAEASAALDQREPQTESNDAVPITPPAGSPRNKKPPTRTNSRGFFGRRKSDPVV